MGVEETFERLRVIEYESSVLGALLLDQVKMTDDRDVFVNVELADCNTDVVANMSTAYTEGSTGFMKLTSVVSKLVSPKKIFLYYKIKKNGGNPENTEERAFDLTGVTLDAVKSGNYDGLVQAIAGVILGGSAGLLQIIGAIPPEPSVGMDGLPFGQGVAYAAGKPYGTTLGDSLTAIVPQLHPDWEYVVDTGSVFAQSNITKDALINSLKEKFSLTGIRAELPIAAIGDIEGAIEDKLKKLTKFELYRLINYLLKN
jgi:hypothetical protein